MADINDMTNTDNEELIRKNIESELQKEIVERLIREKAPIDTNESRRIEEYNDKIKTVFKQNEILEREHSTLRKEYQERIKKENWKPVIVPVFFFIIFFAVVNLLLSFFFRGIFDETPLLQYAWVLCLVIFIVIVIGVRLYISSSKSKRKVMGQRIAELQQKIKENNQTIKAFENERDKKE